MSIKINHFEYTNLPRPLFTELVGSQEGGVLNFIDKSEIYIQLA